MKPRTDDRPMLALAVALTLVLPAVLLWLPGQAEASTSRALTINNQTSDPQNPFKAFDGNPTKVYDINGDGTQEIIAQNDNQWVYIFDPETGDIVFETKTHFPPGWGARSFNGPEVSIMERDGNVHLILANSAAVITSYRFDPADSSKGNFKFDKEWDRRLDDCHDNPGMDAKPVLADLDEDGTFEILAATEEQGLYVLNADGTLFWKNCLGGGNAAPGIGDLDQDGQPDVVHVSDAGIVSALDGRSGDWMWSFDARQRFDLGSGSMPVAPAVAQLDGNGGPDVVVGARDSHDPDNWDNNHALLLALDSNGDLLWCKQHHQANPLTYTRPVVVDADEDGQPEVYWGDWNTNGHKPPYDESDAWQRLGPANVYRYEADGTLTWHQTLGTWWSNKDLALADVDGDGTQEVLANGPKDGSDGIWYLDANTGEKETFVDISPYKVQRAPVVADLYGDGTMQWVVQVAPNSQDAGGHGVLVYDTGQAYDAAWPHVPYPTLGDGGEPTGTFDATFRVYNSGEWWQQVEVRPDTPRDIQKVEIRIDGSAWRSMTLEDWGHWTSSYHTPEGTQVEFLATDTDGQVSQSQPFTWISGDNKKQSTEPSDGQTPFDPTYRVSDNVNEWWVEVYVDASDPITSVEVQIDGGDWIALDEKDWGSWAKSVHAPQGSDVVFKATRSDGAQDTSQTYTWMTDEEASFSASFTPKAQGNDWWVETDVDANKPVVAVDARIDGGQWRALDKQDWGSWAKSIHAPDGSQVQFQAHSDSGETVTSDTYRWD